MAARRTTKTPRRPSPLRRGGQQRVRPKRVHRIVVNAHYAKVTERQNFSYLVSEGLLAVLSRPAINQAALDNMNGGCTGAVDPRDGGVVCVGRHRILGHAITTIRSDARGVIIIDFTHAIDWNDLPWH